MDRGGFADSRLRHDALLERAARGYVGSVGGAETDAVCSCSQNSIHHAGRPRFIATVEVIERELKRSDYVFRYLEKDDFGTPRNAFVICTFWLIDALAAIGRPDTARTLFRTCSPGAIAHGLLAEHLDPGTGEAWGNFVQTYSMVGLINAAIRLSVPWEDAF